MNTLQKLQYKISLLTPAFEMAESIEKWNANKSFVMENFKQAINEDSEWGDTNLQSIFEEEIIPLVSTEMRNQLLSEELDFMSFQFACYKKSHRKFANKYFDFIVKNPDATRTICSSVISNIYTYISTDRIDTFLDLLRDNHSHIGKFGLYRIAANNNLTSEQAIQIAKYDHTFLNKLMHKLTNEQIIEFSSETPTWVIADMAKAVEMSNNELVEWFRTHKNANVRCALAKNPNADRGLLQMLTVDTKKSVINAALNALNN